MGKVAGILANLELSTSKYGLLGKLHELQPGDLDSLYRLLDDWTLRLAKDALDEIQTRLKLIKDLDEKLRGSALEEPNARFGPGASRMQTDSGATRFAAQR